jgi:hypothetical protein
LQLSFVDCGFKGHATPESLFERPEKGNSERMFRAEPLRTDAC